jgi:Amiloride-sensitive sodium channel
MSNGKLFNSLPAVRDYFLFCRTFWFFFMLLGLVLFFSFISMTIKKFLEGKVILKFASKETFIEGIPFPAFTICSQYYHPEAIPVASDDK